ncbi:MAG: LysM peptidoglycan-binding domain-containing protein, partial [Anaerolineales bacterium]|nr:LysM peptidoglycan-binding domain-containing protein [Anaerolineales bacterium]
HTAGVWQRVNVPAGANLRFSVWGQAWSSASDQVPSDFPTVVNMRIGIDPTGGTNPFSGSIVWSGAQNPYDVYVPFEVEATAQGDAVTVFMWSAPQEARKHNDIYWDEASLTIGGGGSPVPAGGGGGGGTSGAPAAPVYVPGPTPTPNADGIILTQAQAGDSSWALAARAGLTLDEFLELNGMSRDDFIKAGEFYVTGSGEPGGAPAEEAAAEGEAAVEGEAAAEGEAVAEAAVEGEAVAATDEGDTVEGGAEVEEPAVEPTAEPAAEEAAVADAAPAEGGSICLRAFDDTNRDGVYNTGEAVKDSVAFTISNNEAVVSNYVTNGSEPFCVNGLPAGTYRVSRSFAQNEVASGSGDWAIALDDGAAFNLDFGSYIDETAAQEVVAQAADDTVAAAENSDTAAAAEGALVNAEDAGSGWGVWLVGIIVAIAAVLLIGVIVVVLSARRVA